MCLVPAKTTTAVREAIFMFGTRADAVVDFAYIVTVLAPLFAFLSVRLVRQGRQAAHMRVQTALLAVCALAVVALEIRIRVAGGAGKLVAGSPHAGSALMNAVAAVHICGAVATYLVWGWLVFLSRRRYRSLLPGAFSRKHKIAGRIVIGGLCFTTLSATAVYRLAFWG